MMFINLNKDSATPLYEQLYQDIKQKILNGYLLGNVKLPSKRQLSLDLSISMTTVERAYDLLVDENMIYTKEKSGHYVTDTEVLHTQDKKLETIKQPTPPNYILPLGTVDTSIVQNDVIKQLSASVFSDSTLLNAGNKSGEDVLKESIKDYLYVNRGVQCVTEQIFIGPSTEYLLEQAFYLLDYPKMTLEDPGYPNVKNVLSRLNIPYDTAHVEADGIDVEAVKRLNNKLTHITPSHQFPSGVVMSLNKRIKLLNAVSHQGGYLIEDDYDSEFRYRGRPLSSLQGLDQNDRTIYMNTFSKSIYPSLRLAVMVLPSELAEKYYESGLSCNVSRQMQHIIARFINEGYLTRHINRVRKFYGEKMNAVTKLLNDKHPGVEISGEHTGMHFVLRVPDVDLRDAARKHRIISMSAYSRNEDFNDTVLIGIGGKSAKEIARILSEFLDEVLN
jgi:GntR family transcriptional regulator/MocR family aminotransferase